MTREGVPDSPSSALEPIAVVGMACRLPKSPDIRSFWRLLQDRVDAVTEVPSERWDASAIYSPDRSAPGKSVSRWGGFLENVDRFDPAFFHISPREAADMDPQQRLALELSWEALEDAGIPPASLKDSPTGVFLGVMWEDYSTLATARLGSITQYTSTGQHPSVVPGRVSFALGLRGPSFAINAACASSLVAVHDARRSLQLKDCSLALAGGINLLLSPEHMVTLSKFGGLSVDGRCKAFDSRANGFVRSDGGGIVVLKPLSQALRDGNPIHCILLGSAVNNDGSSDSLTAPSQQGQELVLRAAYADAGVSPRDVRYVEAHGTGTSVGDPIEAEALGAVLGSGRGEERPLLIGSAKSNIGHTESAAGVAGLIKGALILRHGQVPPSIHFQTPNPNIDFAALRLQVVTSPTPLREGPGRAVIGVSSFGYSGTNCHVVVGDAPATPFILPFGARTQAELEALVERSAEALADDSVNLGLAELQALLCSSFQGPHRLALSARTRKEGTDGLRSFRTGLRSPGLNTGTVEGSAPAPVLFFAGPGSQWLRMGLSLMGIPAFRTAVERCDRVLRPHLGSSLLDPLSSRDGASPGDPTKERLATFLIQAGLAALISALGIRPGAIVGQSLGEVTAAYVAGCLSLEDAARILCGRSPDGIRPRSASIPFFSAVTGQRLDGAALDAASFCRSESEPSLSTEALDRILDAGFDTFLEVSPHPLLRGILSRSLEHAGRSVRILPLVRWEEPAARALCDSLGALWVRGQEIRWHVLRSEEPPAPERAAALGLGSLAGSPPEAPAQPLLLPLSAQSPEALRDMARAWMGFLEEGSMAPLADILYTASVRRSHLTHRLAAAGRTPAELRSQLQTFLSGSSAEGLSQGTAPLGQPRKLAFVFPGQGGQWVAMGRRLLASQPVFREAIEACHDAMREHGALSLLDVLRGEGPDAGMERVDCVQPAVFAMQVGLAALFRSWGVIPGAVIGHSMGEVAAAHSAGWLSLSEACRVICQRSRLVSRASGRGGMALAELPIERAQELLTEYRGELAIAAINGPRTLVLAGSQGALTQLLSRLEQEGVFCRSIKVDYASHSPQMDPLRPELLRSLADVQGANGHIPLYSTVTGQWLDRPPGAGYWAANLREPVRFWDAVQALAREGFDTFLEISAHPTLVSGIADGLAAAVKDLAVIPAMRRSEGDLGGPLAALGDLYVNGLAIDWELLSPHGGRVVPLPAYPFQRQRYWIAAPPPHEGVARPRGGHPLLGLPVQLATEPGTRLFETLIGADGAAHLKDHRVQEAVVLPAAAYVEMALAAGKESLGSEALAVEDLRLSEALTLDGHRPCKVQVVVRAGGARATRVHIASQESESTPWRLHASAHLRAARPGAADTPSSLPALRARCSTEYAVGAFYEALSEMGLIYGPAFRAVIEVFRGPGEALGRVQLPAELSSEAGTYLLHPSLLDGGLQLLLAALRGEGAGGPWLPVRIESVRLHRRPGSGFLAHAGVREARAGWIRGDVRLLDEQGAVLAELVGVELQRLEARGGRAARYWLHEWRPAAQRSAERANRSRILLLADRAGLAEDLVRWLKEQGSQVTLRAPAAKDHPDLSGANPPYTSIVYLGSADAPSGCSLSLDSLVAAARRDSAAVLYLVQALARAGQREAPRLWLVTRGVHAPDADARPLSPAAGVMWGLGRTVANEHPELRCTRVDLAERPWSGEVAALGNELLAAGAEEEVALRSGGRFVARLVHKSLEPELAVAREPAAGRPFRLEIDTPGVLDRLTLRPLHRRVPQAGEVEVEVRAAGLNFIDVLRVMGSYPDQEPGAVTLGSECAGRIVAIGEGVSDLKVGDEVLAVAAGAIASYVTAPAWSVARVPRGLSLEQSAAAPLVMVTAYYSLHTLARLKKGERILIHSAAGGTGLAAVQLAQRLGAEVFATAGSEEKRAYLRSLGIKHVMDSRSLEFAEEISSITQGRGVDVVINSLLGAAIEKSFAVLAPYGRFIELGKRDIYESASLDLGHFRKKLSYFAVDLAGMLKERQEEVSGLLREVLRELGAGTLAPPPVRVFPVSQAQDAFRLMARGGHTGKLVLDLSDPAAEISVQREAVALRGDATYLITGGLGGLGLALAGWMVVNGARHLVLLGRKGAESEEQRSAVAKLKGAGAEVVVAPADVSQSSDVHAVLRRIKERMPALRGIVHAAGLLDDGLLAQQDVERFAKVFAPKIAGAWNLHELTKEEPLDFFVLYSSASALLGLPGQGSYAAANSFLDALAHYRRAAGLPALSLNWGAFSEVGLAAAQANRGQRLAERGMKSLSPQRGNEELGRLLGVSEPQVGVMDLDLRQWIEFYPQTAASSLLSELVAAAKKSRGAERGDTALQKALRAADSQERTVLLRKHVREQLGHVLRMRPAQIDDATPFKSLGLDSLLGLELRNVLEAGLGLQLPATLSWTYPDVGRLAAYLSQKLGETGPSASEAEPARPAAAPQGLSRAELDALSDTELAKLGSDLLD